MNGRSILAVLAGIISGGVIIGLLQGVIHNLFPLDPELAETFKGNPEVFKEYLLTRPFQMYLLVSISHGLGIVGGMFIGNLIDRTNGMTVISVAAILLLANVVNFLSLPHPGWFPFLDLGIGVSFALAFGVYIWRRSRK